MQYSRGRSALVFCSTRRGAQEAAQQLAQTAMTFGHSNPFIKSREQKERLTEASVSCGDKQMQSYILYGGKGLTCSQHFHFLLKREQINYPSTTPSGTFMSCLLLGNEVL